VYSWRMKLDEIHEKEWNIKILELGERVYKHVPTHTKYQAHYDLPFF
jgi:hypothetical protein